MGIVSCTLLLIHVPRLGKKSGLQSAKSLREENLQTKKLEDEQFAVMEKSLSGQGVTTIYRDKSGKKIDLIEEKRKRDEIEKKKMEDNAKYDKWKKGSASSSYDIASCIKCYTCNSISVASNIIAARILQSKSFTVCKSSAIKYYVN